jgi:hypothetical protein
MNDKTMVKWMGRIVRTVAITAVAGPLIYAIAAAYKRDERLWNEVESVTNPVLVVNQDKTTLYQGNGKDRSRGLEPRGNFKYLRVIPDLENSERPYAEIRNFGDAEAREATLHIGRNQPLPVYESLGNGGVFDYW